MLRLALAFILVAHCGALKTVRHSLVVPADVAEFLAETRTQLPSRGSRLGNGRPATNEQFPFVGDVTVRWRDGLSTICTASLIATNWIITARRCIVNDTTSQIGLSLVVEFGMAQRIQGRTSAAGEYGVWKDGDGGVHPDYALFRLRQHLTLSSTINTIRLIPRAEVNNWFPYSAVTIAGWGALDFIGTPASNLMYGTFHNTMPSECTPAAVPGVTRFHFCSSPDSVSRPFLYDGDFGAPVIITIAGTPTLMGVASATVVSSVTLRGLIASTRIGQFMDFITEETGIPWT